MQVREGDAKAAMILWRPLLPGLEFAAAFERTRHRDFVGIFDIGSGRNACGDTADAERGVRFAHFVEQIASGGFTFHSRTGSEDQFLGFGQARPEIAQAKLLRAHTVDRTECAMQHMVQTVEAARLFYAGDIGRLFDDADQASVACG